MRAVTYEPFEAVQELHIVIKRAPCRSVRGAAHHAQASLQSRECCHNPVTSV